MFIDPQAVTIAGAAHSLVKVPSGKVENISKFSGDDGNTVLTVHQNSTNNRFRREFRLTLGKVAADPISAVNKAVNASVILAFDEPKYGFSDTELLEAFEGLMSAVLANSIAAGKKLLNGEL